MMDLALEETVELISFTQGKQFKYVFINECEHCISIWSKTDQRLMCWMNLQSRIFFAKKHVRLLFC